MATVTVTPGWAGPLSAVSSDPIVLQVAGVGPQGSSGVAPSGTGIVTVTSGVLGTPGPLTGDVTTTAGGLATTLATVNSNVGSFTNASITVNAKGQVTAASSGAGGGTWGSITGTLSSQTDLQNALDAKQAADADLTSWAAVTRASGFDTFATTPSSANLAALLTDETGSGAAVFGTSPTLNGTVVVRQSGGTAGVDEVQISHDGTDANIESKDGRIRLIPADVVVLRSASQNRWGWGAWIQGYSGGRVSWGPGSEYGSDDLSIGRASAGVLALRDGSSAGRTLASPPLSPAQITADQANYAPPAGAMIYRVSTDASRIIHGLSIGQVDGQIAEFWNVGSQPFVLPHQSGTATAANRYVCPSALDMTVRGGGRVCLRYDGTLSRWQVAATGPFSKSWSVTGGTGVTTFDATTVTLPVLADAVANLIDVLKSAGTLAG